MLIFTALLAQPVAAQVKSDPGQLVVPPPMMEPPQADGSRCFTVTNKAPYSVTGSVNTNYFTAANGTRARKNVNFRLAPGARQQICTFGPYYPGNRIELVFRTLMPVFSCYTAAQGDIQVYGKVKPEGGSKTWVDCI